MFFLVEFWAWTLCAEVALAIQHLLGCCILGETSQRRSAPVTKFSQPRAWISLKRASRASVQKLCCVIPFFILIIFRSIIQFLVVLFSLLLWLHQHSINAFLVSHESWFSKFLPRHILTSRWVVSLAKPISWFHWYLPNLEVAVQTYLSAYEWKEIGILWIVLIVCSSNKFLSL